MDKAEIRRLQILRFPLILSVIFFHGYDNSISMAGAPTTTLVNIDDWAVTLQLFIAKGLWGIRIPILLIIAGYLLFKGLDNQPSSYFSKLRNRVRSLLVPLVLWNSITLLIIFAAQSHPESAKYFSGRTPWSAPIADFDIPQLLNAIFGLETSPLNYPTWFLRDLFLMCLLAPLLMVSDIRALMILWLAFAGAWLNNWWPYSVPNPNTALFFLTGALLAKKGLSPFLMDNWARPIIIIFTSLLVARFVVDPDIWETYHIRHIYSIFGIIAILCISKYVEAAPRLSNWLESMGKPSFLMFVAHEPLLTALRKLSYVALRPSSSLEVLAIYFASCLSTVGILLGAYILGRRYTPGLLALLTGQRSGSDASPKRVTNEPQSSREPKPADLKAALTR